MNRTEQGANCDMGYGKRNTEALPSARAGGSETVDTRPEQGYNKIHGGTKMTIEQLTEIVKLTDLRKIKKALKAAGFFDCKWSRALCHVPLVPICQAPYEKTDYIPDGRGSEYVADLCHDAKGYEQYQFALVQLLSPVKKGGDLFTEKLLVYAKDITGNSNEEGNEQ